ncbi:MAG TPA: hypothetical protein VFL85_01595 [Candidatus Saccharimonadales bacterium]|nr:hypothetical protein [Candidatus Saccharimonadales bacterium]
MLSVKQFRAQMYPLFHVMRKTGMVVEVVYRGVTYDIHVRATQKPPKLTRRKRTLKQDLPLKIDAKECPACHGMMFEGVCMNTKCSTNNPGASLSA